MVSGCKWNTFPRKRRGDPRGQDGVHTSGGTRWLTWVGRREMDMRHPLPGDLSSAQKQDTPVAARGWGGGAGCRQGPAAGRQSPT